MQARLPFEPSENAAQYRFERHPRARRYVIRVREDGSIRVTIPLWGSRRGAQQFVEREHRWIAKQLALAEEARSRPRLPAPGDEERVVLVARARRELPARLQLLARDLGLTVTRVSVRNQRWRWGSCSRDGHICLNWRLVAMPERVADYVMIHELMHLRRMDHSPRFWKLVEQACTDYRGARTWLRSHADLLG